MNVGVYYYFYRKSRSIFKKKRNSLILVSLFLLIQATPLSLYRLGYITTSDPFGYGWVFLGYSCLSFFSYFLVSFFIFDMSIFAFIKIKKKKVMKSQLKEEILLKELFRRVFLQDL
jgi:hypothetical protein